jgi:thiamine biosynthesis protein ThiS
MTVTVTINGSETDLDEACTVASLLQRLDLAERPCAVELNRRVVPRRDHANCVLRDGDAVEIVTLVGGG